MPTYAYECGACEHRFEEFQSMSAKALRKCPECGKLKLQRMIGPGAGIIFKGTGFYETDYRSSSYKAGESAAKDGGKAAGGSDDFGSADKGAKPKSDGKGADSSSTASKTDKKKA